MFCADDGLGFTDAALQDHMAPLLPLAARHSVCGIGGWGFELPLSRNKLVWCGMWGGRSDLTGLTGCALSCCNYSGDLCARAEGIAIDAASNCQDNAYCNLCCPIESASCRWTDVMISFLCGENEKGSYGGLQCGIKLACIQTAMRINTAFMNRRGS